jgi:hypothetical protein
MQGTGSLPVAVLARGVVMMPSFVGPRKPVIPERGGWCRRYGEFCIDMGPKGPDQPSVALEWWRCGRDVWKAAGARGEVERFSIEEAPRAYERLHAGTIRGRAVIVLADNQDSEDRL